MRTLITPAGWAFAIWGSAVPAQCHLRGMAGAAPPSAAMHCSIASPGPAAVALAAQGVWAAYTQMANLIRDFGPDHPGLAWRVAAGAARAGGRAPGCRARSAGLAAPVFRDALAAWLTAASIVNIAATLKYYGLGAGNSQPRDRCGDGGGGIRNCGVGHGTGARRAAIIGLVFCWALLAIHARGGQAFAPVGWAAMAGGAMVLAALAWQLSQPGNRRHWFGA